MRTEEQSYQEQIERARIEYEIAANARAYAIEQEEAKAAGARHALQIAEAERVRAAEPQAVKDARVLLARLIACDPRQLNEDISAWRRETARFIRRHEMLVTLEEVQAEERARLAAMPATRTLDLRFVAPSDHAVVLHDQREAHLRNVLLDGVLTKFASLTFVRAEEAAAFAAMIAAEEERTTRMGWSTEASALAVVLAPDEWKDLQVVATAARVELRDAKDLWIGGSWLESAINDERVAAQWLQNGGPLTQAIEKHARAAARFKAGVGTLESGRAFWAGLARDVAPVTETPEVSP
jgi:hypothetical protein